jgi:hypothetical protein
LTAVPPRRQLKPRQRVDSNRVGDNAPYVAEGDVGVASLEQGTDALAEPGQVGAGNRSVNGERDRLRR